MACSLALLVILTGKACFARFEGDLKNLQPQRSEAFLTQEKIAKHLSLAPKQMLLVVDGEELDVLLARGRRVEALLDEYRSKGELSAYSSLGQVLNRQATQKEILGKFSGDIGRNDPQHELARALERNGFVFELFQPAIDGLAALQGTQPVPYSEAVARLADSPLSGVVQRHLLKAGGRYHLLFYLYYRGGEFEQRLFLRDLAPRDPTARSTGEELVSEQLAGSVRNSLGRACWAGRGCSFSWQHISGRLPARSGRFIRCSAG